MSLHALGRKFAADRGGVVAIIFALALIPILGLAGGAIDYGRALIVKNRLQNALDSAILAAGATPSLSNDRRITYAKNVFKANYPATEMVVVAEPVVTIGDDGTIKGTADADLIATFLGIIGIHDFEIAASAEAKIISAMEGEIVLVLDNSGSMSDRGKYKTMRDAAKKLLVNTIGQEGKNDKVKFGLVPFAGEVYVTLPKKYVVDQSGNGDWTQLHGRPQMAL